MDRESLSWETSASPDDLTILARWLWQPNPASRCICANGTVRDAVVVASQVCKKMRICGLFRGFCRPSLRAARSHDQVSRADCEARRLGHSGVYFFPEIVFSGSSSRMSGSWKRTAALGGLKKSARLKWIMIGLSFGAGAERAARRFRANIFYEMDG